MALERTVQISGIRGPYSVEQVTSFLPGKMYVEWDAKPADNWVLYITDQAAKTKLTVQIGKLTAEDIQQYKAGNYGAFETEVPLPASLCPTSDSTQLQVYITGSTRITSGSTTLPINYRSNTVSITLKIPNTNEFYPSLKTHEAYAEGYVRGENNQDYLLVGSSKFKSSAEYTPGSGADNGITYVEVYKGVHSDSGETEHRDNGTIEDYTDYETFRITDNPYTYEYQFNEPNTYAFGFVMFDSRARRGDNTAYVSDIFRVWDYARPSVTLTVQRSTTASTPSVVCKYKCSYSKLGDSNNGNLLKQLHIERKDLTDNTEWTAWRDISVNESGQITLPMGSTDNSAYTAHEWAFRGWVDDTIMVSKYPTESARKTNSTMSQVSQIQSEFRVFNIHKDGKGLAVGKIATEADKLDVNIPTIFRDNVTFDKEAIVSGLKDANDTSRTLKCSYIDNGTLSGPTAIVGCKLGSNGPRYANISQEQALTLLGIEDYVISNHTETSTVTDRLSSTKADWTRKKKVWANGDMEQVSILRLHGVTMTQQIGSNTAWYRTQPGTGNYSPNTHSWYQATQQPFVDVPSITISARCLTSGMVCIPVLEYISDDDAKIKSPGFQLWHPSSTVPSTSPAEVEVTIVARGRWK